MNVPDALTDFLGKMKRDLPLILRENLIGIYLWGSLTYEAFDERHSDLDCIVVTKHDPTEREFAQLTRWFREAWESEAWARKLDLRFVIENELLDKKSRCCQFHFGEFVRTGSDGNPFICLNLRQSGITVWGADAKLIAPEVTRDCLRDGLLLELAYLREDLAANAGQQTDLAFAHLAYAILTACRIAYTVAHGTLVSKQRAFAWALETFPADWRPLMIAAESNRRQSTGTKTADDEAAAMEFVCFVEARTQAAFRADAEGTDVFRG